MYRILTAAILLIFIAVPTNAQIKDDAFVRTANYFLMSGPVLDQSLDTLATFDLIIIPVEAQVYNKAFFKKIRSINTDIIILPYIPTVSWNDLYWEDPLHQSLYTQIENDWWLTNSAKEQVSVWPGTRALNLNSGWIEFLPSFVKNEVLSSGLWDGVFYDEVQDSISWLGDVDVNDDGKRESAREADELWEARYVDLFSRTRDIIGSDYIMITNGSSNSRFAASVNGRMFESFPSSDNTLAQWEGAVNDYLQVEEDVAFDSVQVINVNTNNTGEKTDYQSVRFGMTTTLLGGGFFSFDFGTENHAQLWTYDEYDAYLGAPKSTLQSATTLQETSVFQDILFKEFENGQVIVNATSQAQTIQLEGEFEKLHGSQDPDVNNGRIIYEVTVAAQDGVILLRPIEEILDATFLNGAFARIFSLDGTTKRTGFFAYEKAQRGGMEVVHFDTDGDGERELITADETFVYIYNPDGSMHTKFAPYTDTYTGGINISVGDLENDGSVEIVTGTENGGGPHVRVFDQDGTLINPGFFAYADSFRGGVHVSIGDLNGDGIKEIITGAGVGGGPHVRVFKKDGTLINPGFFAYEESFRGGVNVSAGDVDGDGIDDILTGPGRGGSSLARIFDRSGTLKNEFFVFETSGSDGLEVVSADLDGDGVDEIIGLTTDVFTLSNY